MIYQSILDNDNHYQLCSQEITLIIRNNLMS